MYGYCYYYLQVYPLATTKGNDQIYMQRDGYVVGYCTYNRWKECSWARNDVIMDGHDRGRQKNCIFLNARNISYKVEK